MKSTLKHYKSNTGLYTGQKHLHKTRELFFYIRGNSPILKIYIINLSRTTNKRIQKQE